MVDSLAVLGMMTSPDFALLSSEDPGLVPDIIPNRKESGGYKLADFGLYTQLIFEYRQYEIVQQKGVERRVNDVAASSHE